jgi:hypothetical protein
VPRWSGIGTSCPGTRQTGSYSSVCELAQTGHVIVTNPTALGLGADVSVTVKITKLARLGRLHTTGRADGSR